MVQKSDPVTLALTGQLPFILIYAAVLAWLISILLLKRYHSAVLKSMLARNGSPPGKKTTLVTSLPTDQSNLSGLDIHSSSINSGLFSDTLFQQVMSRPRQALKIYVLAGFCYAIVMTIARLISGEFEFLPIRFILVLLNYAWPVVLTIYLVLGTSRLIKYLLLLGYFTALLLVGATGIVLSPTANWRDIFILWLVVNLPPTILFFAFFNHRVRAVGPLVFTFLVLAITGSYLSISLVGRNDASIRTIVDIGSFFGLGGTGILMAVRILGIAVFGLLGWLTLKIIRKKYEHKKISDQSIMLDALWVLFAIDHSVYLVFGGIYWVLSGVVAYITFKLVTRIGFSLLGDKPNGKQSPQLLFLRVFSLGKRSEHLFDKLSKHWRYVSSIQLIAGPDLINSTVEPHEFLDFITGKLARRFIDSPQALEKRLSEMDIEPDQDRRFRKNDFFCHDDTWKMCFSQLVDKSNVVLMDLRGFSSENKGCKFEVDELINTKPLDNLIFIIDESTNEKYLHQTLQDSWNNMASSSPNRLTTPAQLSLFRFSGSENKLEQLLHSMCVAACKRSLEIV